ncbi:hypothetical protein [Burkholderia ubonensis]|uniref:hypothetical protein n=1 Tax=Burkholderia ubonensis TaxID=101571 RepID=UPI001160CF9C|nr:hypothetical protein [Burkholderia ubonensis]
MSKTSNTFSGINYGVQASSVNAENLAVGPNSIASTNVGGVRTSDLLKEVELLRQGLNAAGIHPQAQQLLAGDISALSNSLTVDKPDSVLIEGHLKGFIEKLRTIGVVLGDFTEIIGPLKTIADALRIPLAALGLST